MKNLLIILLISSPLRMIAQGDEYYNSNTFQHYQQSEIITNPSIQPPDVAAFQKVNFIPVDNYTGRAKVSIPIFDVQSGNITVPISISYNTSGVKVNEVSSSVGSNWSLNAGGSVSRIVKGMDDFEKRHLHNYTIEFDHYCGRMGYIYGKYHDYEGASVSIDGNDSDPDLFLVSAPGLNTSYIHTGSNATSPRQNGSSGDIFELTGQQNRIVEVLGDKNYTVYQVSNLYPNNDYYFDGGLSESTSIFGLQTLSITNTSGLEYQFNKEDVSQYSYLNDPQYVDFYGNSDPTSVVTNVKQESFHLTKIIDKQSNKEVSFSYETYSIGSYDPIDTNYFFDGNQSPYSDEAIVTPKSMKYPVLNRLVKITYDKGTVDFIYGLNRQDIVGDKALTQIIIKDNNGLVIKKFNLEYSYMVNSAYSSSPQNKRLRLDQVYFSDKNNVKLPNYVMTYNSAGLPPRGTWGKDFLGYHNGSYNPSISNARPKVYFYPDNNENSFLPVNIGAGYYLINGDYSMASNLTYARAGILERIDYPTGGYSQFEYDLNQFKIKNISVSGGGLRIKSQKIVDQNGNEQILDYEYKELDNSNSGRIVTMPNFIDFRVRNTYTGTLNPSYATNYFSFKIYRTPQMQSELTSNSFVGYSRVVVKNRISNGETEYVYLSPKQYPDQMHNYTAVGGSSNDRLKVDIAYNNGMRASIHSNEVYRGKLKSKTIFDVSGNKVKETINNFTYSNLEEFNYNNDLQLCTLGSCMNIAYNGPMLIENVNAISERFLLTSTVNKTYPKDPSSQPFVSAKYFTYDFKLPLVIKEQQTNCEFGLIDGKYPCQDLSNNNYDYQVIKEIIYPLTSGNSSQEPDIISTLPFASNLIAQNRLTTPLEIIYKNSDNEKVRSEKHYYQDFGNGIISLEKVDFISRENKISDSDKVTKRDSNSNIIEFKKSNGVFTSIVYGYDNNYIIAKVENCTYSNIEALPSFGTNFIITNGLSAAQEGELRSLNNAMVTTYTYNPLIGVSSITDSRGNTTNYEYDTFNRLLRVRDQDGNILKEAHYHYKQ